MIGIVGVICASMAWGQAPEDHKELLRLIDGGRFAEARVYAANAIRQAPATTRPCELAALYFDQGTAENSLNHYAAATESYGKARALCGSSPEAPPRFLVALLSARSVAQTSLGRFDEAAHDLRSALKIAEKFPAEDEELARVHQSLGMLARHQGLFAQAERHYRRSIGVYRAVLGASHPDVAMGELELVQVLLQQGRDSEALPVAIRVYEQLVSKRGAAHPDTLFALQTVAMAKMDRAPSEAESMLRDARAAWQSRFPENQWTQMQIWNALGVAQLAQGRAPEAADSFTRSLEIARAVAGSEAETTLLIMENYARSLKAAKRKKESASISAEVDRVRREKGFSPSQPHAIDIRSVLSRQR